MHIVDPELDYDFPAIFAAAPLLTADEERSLAATIVTGRTAAAALAAGTVPARSRRRYEKQVAEGTAARNRFVEANVRLALHHARRYTGRGVAFPDLVQEGVLGIIHALGKYDPDRGFRFSTYATPWVKQYMGRAISQNGRLVRLPEEQISALGKIANAQRDLPEGQAPTAETLADKTGLDPVRVRALLPHLLAPVSLHTPVGDEDGAVLADLLADQAAPGVEEQVAETMASEAVSAILDTLSEREAQVIRMRFGFLGQAQTLDEVGKQMNLTRERVRQIEAAALGKLRHPAHRAALGDLVA